MNNIPLIVIGAVISLLGCLNIMGNISSIHWYNRRKVTEEDIPKYGRLVGSGTLVIGISMIVTGILQMIFNNEIIYYITAAGIVIGIVLIFWGQFKYNKGIF